MCRYVSKHFQREKVTELDPQISTLHSSLPAHLTDRIENMFQDVDTFGECVSRYRYVNKLQHLSTLDRPDEWNVPWSVDITNAKKRNGIDTPIHFSILVLLADVPDENMHWDTDILNIRCALVTLSINSSNTSQTSWNAWQARVWRLALGDASVFWNVYSPRSSMVRAFPRHTEFQLYAAVCDHSESRRQDQEEARDARDSLSHQRPVLDDPLQYACNALALADIKHGGSAARFGLFHEWTPWAISRSWTYTNANCISLRKDKGNSKNILMQIFRNKSP